MPVLLTTKLHMPRTDERLTLRMRLIEELTVGLARDVTLVCAPAGYGKTTVAAAWLRQLAQGFGAGCAGVTRRTAWLALDTGDDDFTGFFTYFVAALRTAVADVCPQTALLLTQIQRSDPDLFALTLAAECAALPQRVVLVLEDLHSVQNSTIHRVLMHLVRYSAEKLHLVLVTRADPPWGIARLRAYGQLAEIRAANLQFTRTEILQLLEHDLDVAPTADLVDVLQTRTEGWVAGLQLAVIGLRTHADPAAFVDGFRRNSPAYVFDYLVDEVVASQPAEVQRFLFYTAPLRRFCAPLCAAVLRDVDEAACLQIIAHLITNNLFVVTLDDQQTWHRYHHQFAKMLRIRGRLDAAQQRQVQRAGGDWLAAHGWTDEAIQQYGEAGAWEQAAMLIESKLPDCFDQERGPQLVRWMAHIPAAYTAQRPLLLLAKTWIANFTYRFAEIPPLVESAAALLARSEGVEGTEAQQLGDGIVAAWRASDTYDGLLSEEKRMAQAQLALALVTPDQQWWRGFVLNELAFLLVRLGRRAEALPLLEKELQSVAPERQVLRLRLLYALGVLYYNAGCNHELLATGQEYLQLAEARRAGMSVGWAHMGLGHAYHMRGSLAEAAAHYAAVLAPGSIASSWTRLLSSRQLIEIYAACGMAEAALALPAQLRSQVGEVSASFQQQIEALDAFAHLLCGDRARAAAWGRQPHSLPADLLDVRHTILAHILLADQQAAGRKRAAEIMARQMANCSTLHNERGKLEAALLLASVWWESGRQEDALALAGESLQWAYAHDFGYWFTAITPQAEAILLALAKNAKYGEQARLLLATRQNKPSPHAPHIQQPATSVEAAAGVNQEALSEREIEVLRLLYRRLGNKEIGRLLCISPHTVRNHTSSIYTKLQVSSRRQAVLYGLKQGLIQAEEQNETDQINEKTKQ